MEINEAQAKILVVSLNNTLIIRVTQLRLEIVEQDVTLKLRDEILDTFPGLIANRQEQIANSNLYVEASRDERLRNARNNLIASQITRDNDIGRIDRIVNAINEYDRVLSEVAVATESYRKGYEK